jgi:hypothetical protein
VSAEPADPAYRAARRVLLDALLGLRLVLDSLVLVGAQAVYLRTRADALPIAPFTTDGDLTIDPRTLSVEPPLEELMKAADFELNGEVGREEPGIWHKLVGSLESGDTRSVAVRVRVAGTAVLLVAKTHKLNDRISKGAARRIDDKDAADVVRLLQSSEPAAVAATLGRLCRDADAGPTSEVAVERFAEIFGRRGATGIAMAASALEGAMPPERVQAICLDYADRLRATLRAEGS